MYFSYETSFVSDNGLSFLRPVLSSESKDQVALRDHVDGPQEVGKSSLVVHVKRLELLKKLLCKSELDSIHAGCDIKLSTVNPESREVIREASLVAFRNTYAKPLDVHAGLEDTVRVLRGKIARKPES